MSADLPGAVPADPVERLTVALYETTRALEHLLLAAQAATVHLERLEAAWREIQPVEPPRVRRWDGGAP